MGQCKSQGKDLREIMLKSSYRENMGQSESKERGFKEQKRRL
jgi:hypothetical protein